MSVTTGGPTRSSRFRAAVVVNAADLIRSFDGAEFLSMLFMLLSYDTNSTLNRDVGPVT